MALDSAEVKLVSLEGPATIYEVAAHRDTLREALAEGADLRIDLSHTGKWDLAGLQLLISCVNTAHSQGLAVRIEGVPRPCLESAARSGLSEWLETMTE